MINCVSSIRFLNFLASNASRIGLRRAICDGLHSHSRSLRAGLPEASLFNLSQLRLGSFLSLSASFDTVVGFTSYLLTNLVSQIVASTRNLVCFVKGRLMKFDGVGAGAARHLAGHLLRRQILSVDLEA